MKRKIFFYNLIFLIGIVLVANAYSGEQELRLSLKKRLHKQDAFVLISIKDRSVKILWNKDFILSKPLAPGSTFKLLTALSALKKDKQVIHNVIKCNDRYFVIAKGINKRRIDFQVKYALVGDYYRCSKLRGHKKIGFYKAITMSCNVYFFILGEKTTYDYYYKFLKELGFGKKVFPKLEREQPGFVKKSTLRTEQILSFIGEGNTISATALQMAYFMYFIATKGNGNNITLKLSNKVYLSRSLYNKNKLYNEIQEVQKGLIQKVSTGTDFLGRKINNFAGKTGTITSPYYKGSSGWFIGYAPIRNPEYVFVVFIHKGGGKNAMELFEKVFFTAF